MENTLVEFPSETTDEHTVFAGVTVRDQEDTAEMVYVRMTGVVRCRVMGPASVGDGIGLSAGNDYFEVVSGSGSVGVVRQEIATDEVKLIECNLGGGGGGSRPVWQ